jgi:hypothetical protein
MARAKRKQPRPRGRKPQGRRRWILLPAIILAVMLGWLYRDEIIDLATFRFKGIDFTGPAGETKAPEGTRITEKERKELEKILKSR